MRLGARREGTDLLVAHVEPLDLALTANGIGEAIQAVPDDAVNPFDSGDREGFCKLICNGSHVLLRVQALMSDGVARERVRASYVCRLVVPLLRPSRLVFREHLPVDRLVLEHVELVVASIKN